jgi:hypothetical protein
VNSFGKGAWGVNPDSEATDKRYHESDGVTTWGSPNQIFAPMLQHNDGPSPALMLNLHFQETRGTIIDSIIACAADRALGGPQQCGAITDMLILTSQEEEPGPGALIMEPIYPTFANTTLTGLIASSIVWDESLQNVFSADVSGVDCVLTTETQVYTYGVTGGKPYLK